MARQGGDQTDPQVRASDALRYWYAQETAQLPDMPPTEQADYTALPGGWWIAPVLLASVLAWVMIGWVVFL